MSAPPAFLSPVQNERETPPSAVERRKEGGTDGGRENETTVFLSLHLFSINSEMPCSAGGWAAKGGRRAEGAGGGQDEHSRYLLPVKEKESLSL